MDDIFLDSFSSGIHINIRREDRALKRFKTCNEKDKSDSVFSQIGGLSSFSLFLKLMDAKIVRVCGDIG